MKLSVKLSTVESNLVTHPIGPTATREATGLGDLEAAASQFDELFPELGASATEQQLASIGPRNLPSTGDASPVWIGSLMLRPNVAQNSGALVCGEPSQSRGISAGGPSAQLNEHGNATENSVSSGSYHGARTAVKSGGSVLRRRDKIESTPSLPPSMAPALALSDQPVSQILPASDTVAEAGGDLPNSSLEESDSSADSDLNRDSDKLEGMSGQSLDIARFASRTPREAPDSIGPSNDRRNPSNQAGEANQVIGGISQLRSFSSQRDTASAAALEKNARAESLMVFGEVDSPNASAPLTEIGSLQRPLRDGFALTVGEGERVALMGKEREQFALAGPSRTAGTKSDVNVVSAEKMVSSASGVDFSTQIDQGSLLGLPQSSGPFRRVYSNNKQRAEGSQGEDHQYLKRMEAAPSVSDRTGNQIPVFQAIAVPVLSGFTVQQLYVPAESISPDFGSRSKQPVLADGFAHLTSHRASFSSSPAKELSGEQKNGGALSLELPGGTDLARTGSMNVGNAVVSGGVASGMNQLPTADFAPASALSDRLIAVDAHERPEGFDDFQSMVPPVGVDLNIERANPTAQAFVESTSFAGVVIPNETMASGMGNVFPLLRSEKTLNPHGAKIAAAPVYSRNGANSGDLELNKKLLNAVEYEFKSDVIRVGTSVANSDAVMPAAAITTHPIASDLSDRASMWNEMISPSLERTAAVDSSMHSTESTDSAYHAVEAVLTAADRVSSGGRQSVNLRFSVGGVDLDVRVEMRADQVHATFRTDSPELRSALANEWHSVNAAGNGESSLRLAAPIFTSNANLSNSSNTSPFAGGDGSSRQRDPRANQSQEGTFELGATAFPRRAHFVRTVSSGDSISPASSGGERTVSPALTRRLQTHA